MYLCVSLCIILYFTDCSRARNGSERRRRRASRRCQCAARRLHRRCRDRHRRQLHASDRDSSQAQVQLCRFPDRDRKGERHLARAPVAADRRPLARRGDGGRLWHTEEEAHHRRHCPGERRRHSQVEHRKRSRRPPEPDTGS